MNFISLYILIWPIISAGLLILLITALIRDIISAKRSGEEML